MRVNDGVEISDSLRDLESIPQVGGTCGFSRSACDVINLVIGFHLCYVLLKHLPLWVRRPRPTPPPSTVRRNC